MVFDLTQFASSGPTAPRYVYYDENALRVIDGELVGNEVSGFVAGFQKLLDGAFGFGVHKIKWVLGGNIVSSLTTQIIVNEDGTVQIGEVSLDAAGVSVISLIIPEGATILTAFVLGYGANWLYTKFKNAVTGAVDDISNSPQDFMEWVTDSETVEVRHYNEAGGHTSSVFFPAGSLGTPPNLAEIGGVEALLQRSTFDMSGGKIKFYHQDGGSSEQLSGTGTYDIFSAEAYYKIIGSLQNILTIQEFIEIPFNITAYTKTNSAITDRVFVL